MSCQIFLLYLWSWRKKTKADDKNLQTKMISHQETRAQSRIVCVATKVEEKKKVKKLMTKTNKEKSKKKEISGASEKVLPLRPKLDHRDSNHFEFTPCKEEEDLF